MKTQRIAISQNRRPFTFVRILKLGLLLGTAAYVIACGGSLEETSIRAQDDPEYQKWVELAEKSRETIPPSPDFSSLPEFPKDTAEFVKALDPDPLPKISVKNITLTRKMDVGVLLRALADAANLNVLLSENISGPINMNLSRETQWDRLFLAVTEARGIHYDLQGDLLSLYSVQDIQNQIELAQALNEQAKAIADGKRAEPKIVEMVRIRYANLENIVASVGSTMSSASTKSNGEGSGNGADSEAGFTIKPAADSGQVILHGVPQDVAQARKLIRGLDKPAYQILIHASIVQANNEAARQLGMQWGVTDLSNSSGDAQGLLGLQQVGLASNFPAGFDLAEQGLLFGASSVRGSSLLQAQLSALQRDGRLNIVSSPSVTTLDQMTAVIESGEERPFASASGTGVAAVAQVEFKKALLRLEVTPHVIDTNWVKLDINTTKDDFDDTRTIIVDGNAQTPINTRSAVTSLYLATGQTTVIGGLSSKTKSSQEEGVPFLKNIPGLGAMFRNSSDRDSFNDTLIFITPHILPRGSRKGK